MIDAVTATLTESAGFRAAVRTRARDWSRTVQPLHVFGGRPLLDADVPVSRVTDRPLHVTFDLDLGDPRLESLGITSVDRLVILANFNAEVSRDPLVVRHHDRGHRLELLREPAGPAVAGLPDELPQLPVDLEPISAAEAAVESVDEYPEGHGPLHQVGGRPVWLHGPLATPTCPLTGAPMRFVATVDSELRFPLPDGEAQLLFGDCGMLYVFWSDAAGISAAVAESG